MWHFGYFFVKNNIGLTKNLECFFQKLLQTIIFSIEKMSILQNKVNFEGKTNWRKSTDEFRALQFAWRSQGIVQEKGGERTIGGEANRNLPVPAAVGTREFWNSRSHWNSYRIMFLEENKEYSNGKLTWKQLLKTHDPQSKIVYLIERERERKRRYALSLSRYDTIISAGRVLRSLVEKIEFLKNVLKFPTTIGKIDDGDEFSGFMEQCEKFLVTAVEPSSHVTNWLAAQLSLELKFWNYQIFRDLKIDNSFKSKYPNEKFGKNFDFKFKKKKFNFTRALLSRNSWITPSWFRIGTRAVKSPPSLVPTQSRHWEIPSATKPCRQFLKVIQFYS